MDQKPPYSVEDILLEHELEKKKKEGVAHPQKPTASPQKSVSSRKAGAPKPPRSAADIFRAPKKPSPPPAAKTPPDADIKIVPPVRVAPATAPKPAPKAEEDTLSMEPVRVAPDGKPAQERPRLTKKEEDTRPLGPIRMMKPAEQKTVAVSTRTRVLTVDREAPNAEEPALPDQLEGQMVMDNFVEAPMDEERIESELRERRREKVDGFRIVEGGRPAFKLVGEEEESDPGEELVPEEEPAEEMLEDFNEYAESEAIRSELAYRRRMGAFGVIATVALEALLLAVTLLYEVGALRFMSAAVLTAFHTALLVGVLCVNNRLVTGGIKSLVHLRADADTPPAVCGVVGLLYTVAQFAALHHVTAGSAMFLSAAAGMCVLAGALGRQMQDMRISRNFAFVSGEKHKKYAACFIENERTAAELGRPATVDGIPPMVYYHKASFLERYLDISYGHDPADRVMRWFTPIVLGVSLLCAIGYGLLFPAHAWMAPTVFVSVLLLASPVWALFATQRALTRSCKAALKNGVMIGGFSAVERFGRRHKSVIVDATELFPKEQIKLHGIKTFSGTRIDDAITDAAAVVIGARSPLEPIFRRLIENRMEILREVDSLAYEQDMGLSGWVGGRRVLIGNRRLLENHGVEVPSKEYEARYVKDDRHVVYLSTGGELSAMFVVSYLADSEIKALVKALYRRHAQLLIRSCDPNITVELVCRVMELPSRSAEVLTAAQGRVYDALLDEMAEQRAEASLACGGRAVSRLYAVAQCGRLYRATWAALATQLIISVACLTVSAFVSATTGLVLTPPALVGCILASGVVGWLVGRIGKA